MIILSKRQTLIFLGWLASIWFMKMSLMGPLSATITTTAIGILSLLGILIIEKHAKH